MLLANSNENNNGCFDSSECTTSANRPYVVMTYDDNTSTPPESGNGSFATATAMTLGTNYQVNITSAGGKKYFKFTPSVTGFYTFESSNTVSGDPYGMIYNSSTQQLAYNDNLNSVYNDFRITYHLVAGTTYYFVASCDASSVGSYSVNLQKTTTQMYVEAVPLNCGEKYLNNTTKEYESNVYMVNPNTIKDYLFFTSECTAGDPKMWLYDNELELVGCSDDDISNRNALIEKTLQFNNTYYIVSGHYDDECGRYSINTFQDIGTDSDFYYIKNLGSHMCIIEDDATAAEYGVQLKFIQKLDMQWYIQKVNNQYYTIKSNNDNCYLGMSATISSGNLCKIYSSQSDLTKWKIYTNVQEDILLRPVTAPTGMFLCSVDDVEMSGFNIAEINTGINTRWNLADCSAYFYEKKHLSGLTFNIEITGKFPNDSEWIRYARESMSIWNNSDVNTHITEGNSGIKFEVTDRDDNNNYYGWTEVYNDNSAVMIIYKNKIESFSEVKRLGVYVHEIGHLFALADDPPKVTVNKSLMHHFRPRETIYQPQAYDIHNVNFIYK